MHRAAVDGRRCILSIFGGQAVRDPTPGNPALSEHPPAELGQSHLSHSLGLDRQIQALAAGFGNPAGAKRAFRCPKVCPTL